MVILGYWSRGNAGSLGTRIFSSCNCSKRVSLMRLVARVTTVCGMGGGKKDLSKREQKGGSRNKQVRREQEGENRKEQARKEQAQEPAETQRKGCWCRRWLCWHHTHRCSQVGSVYGIACDGQVGRLGLQGEQEQQTTGMRVSVWAVRWDAHGLWAAMQWH